ncbi:unnamed protein product, partial [Symbiodinium sp. CCMP2456]
YWGACSNSAVQSAGDVLARAQETVAQGAQLAKVVGDAIATKAAFGSEVAKEVVKVGPLVAGLATEAWDQIKSFIDCMTESTTLCHILIGEHWDEYMQAYKMASQVMKSRDALKPRKAKAPAGSCETGLEVAVDVASQFTPDIAVKTGFNGDTEISIAGTVRASIHALVEGEGSCSFRAERGLPKVPKTKVVCARFLAELEVKGTLTGTIETSADVDYEIKGTVVVKPNGQAESSFESPTIKHQDGFAIGASASTSVRVGMGPVFTVWPVPVPGIPINFNAMINAEAKALGTLQFGSGMFLLQEDQQFVPDYQQVVEKIGDVVEERMQAERQATTIEMCGAASLSAFADIDITAFALPSSFRAVLNSDLIVAEIQKAMAKGATALIQLISGPLRCIPGGDAVSGTIETVAETASDTITSLIPALDLDFTVKSIQLLEPQKLWCKEIYKTPGFDQAPCAATLGCKFAGRPPLRDVESPPPEQVTNQLNAADSAPSCSSAESSVKMGDRFIQIGTFRLGAVDDDHFSVSHESGWTAQIYRSDGTAHCRNDHRRQDYGTWDRPVENSRGISFGFQYIQIGKFRLGAIDEHHMSLSHENGVTIIIFRSDRHRFIGNQSDWGAFDRGEAALRRGIWR